MSENNVNEPVNASADVQPMSEPSPALDPKAAEKAAQKAKRLKRINDVILEGEQALAHFEAMAKEAEQLAGLTAIEAYAEKGINWAGHFEGEAKALRLWLVKWKAERTEVETAE